MDPWIHGGGGSSTRHETRDKERGDESGTGTAGATSIAPREDLCGCLWWKSHDTSAAGEHGKCRMTRLAALRSPPSLSRPQRSAAAAAARATDDEVGSRAGDGEDKELVRARLID